MIKITIIEDDPVISQMYRMKFEADGFDVTMAGNGKEGVESVEKSTPDIILMDIQMPEMDGVEALTKIRQMENGRDIPVIILTNLGTEEAPSALKKLNVANYIVKASLTPKQVVAKVKETLQV